MVTVAMGGEKTEVAAALAAAGAEPMAARGSGRLAAAGAEPMVARAARA